MCVCVCVFGVAGRQGGDGPDCAAAGGGGGAHRQDAGAPDQQAAARGRGARGCDGGRAAHPGRAGGAGERECPPLPPPTPSLPCFLALAIPCGTEAVPQHRVPAWHDLEASRMCVWGGGVWRGSGTKQR